MKMMDIANKCPLASKCRIGGKSQLTTRALLILSLMLFWGLNDPARLRAEGTRQAAPSPNDMVMLLTSRPDFSNFAAFNGPADSRLYVTVNDPNGVVYIGLSPEFTEEGAPIENLENSRFRFRIRRLTDGAVVHGPFLVDRTNANVNSWQDALFGNYDVSYVDPTTGRRIFEFRPGQAGDFFIEFQDVGNDGSSWVHIGYWDFTVVEGGIVKNGRLWSRNWALRTPEQTGTDPAECVWDREFNGTFYSYTTDGFVSKIEFQNSGFQGLAFTIAFNSKGPGNTGILTEDRKSIPGRNATRNAAEHKIFVNEPCQECFPDGECGTVNASTTFQCAPDGGFCLPVSVSRAGQVQVVLDFDRNGEINDDEQDVVLSYNFQGNDLATCIPWDGLKGDGSPVGFGDTINLIITYTQGVQHWAVYDVEFLKNGFCVEPVRPLCGNQLEGVERLFWDDRDIPEDPGTNQSKDGRTGCDCGVDGCRTWTNFSPNAPCDSLNDDLTTGYGDKSTLNTWWFANIRSQTQAGIPFLTCQVTGRDSICTGETTEFLVEVSSDDNLDQLLYSWEGPGGFTSTSTSTGPITLAGEYRVTVTDPQGCTTNCSLVLNVAAPPQLALAEVIDASCENINDGGITVTASGGYGQFTYSIDGVNFQSSNTFVGLPAGDYVVLLRDGGGCEASLPVTVGVEDPITIDFIDTLQLCPGDRAQIGPPANSAYIYEWTPATGLDDPTAPNPVVSVDQTTTYIVNVRTRPTSTCPVSDTVVVLVSDQIGLTITGGGVSCSPTTTLTASTTTPARFTWLDATGNVLGTSAELTVSVTGEAVYRVRAETPAGCTDEAEVTVTDGSIDVDVPKTVAVCLGETITINTTNNKPGQQLTYQWSPAELIVPGTENSPNPEIIPQVGENIVRVAISNELGCTAADSVLVAVIDPNFTLDFASTVQCNGATVDFTNTSTNITSFLWTFGDPNNPDASSRELNPVYTYSEPGTYTVTLTVGYEVDCATSIQKNVVIIDPQIIADFTYQLTDCGPDGATVTFQDASRNSFNNTIAWSWTFSNGVTSTDQNPVVNIGQNGPLVVEMTINTANNCQASKKDTLPVRLPKITIPDTLVSCSGAPVPLNPGGDTSLQYVWTPAEGLSDPTAANPQAAPAATTLYTVTVTGFVGDQTCSVVDEVLVVIPEPIGLQVSEDQTTCGEDVLLQASANVPVTFTWRNSQGVTVGSGPEISVNPARRDTYTVIARDIYECTAIDSVTVIDNGVDIRLVAPAQEVVECGAQTIAVEVENLDPEDILTFQWSPANRVSDPTAQNPVVFVDAGTVTFTAEVTNQFGCIDSLRFRVTALPFASGLPDTVFACAGVPTPLNPGFDPNYTYTWTPTDNLDLTVPGNPVFTGNADAIYTVTVSGRSANTDCEVETTVTVIVLPEPDLQVSNDTTLCQIAEITLTASTTTPGVNITWYDDPALANPIGAGPQLTVTPPLGTNVYYALADQNQACSALDSVVVTVPDFDPDDLFEDIVSVCENTPTPLNPNGNPDFVYVWDPTDGLDLSQPWNPIATLATDATYSLTITDPVSGCSVSGEVLVVVSPALNLVLSDDVVLCETAPVTLTATTNVPATIRWYDNADLNGPPVATGNQFTVTPATSGVFTYYVVADDGSVCTETGSVTITVSPEFESGIISPLTVCANTPTLVSLNPQLQYEWTPTTGLDLSNPASPVITLETDVAYRIIVTDPASGCFKEEELLVIVAPAPGLEASGDTTLCQPGSVTLTATTRQPAVIRWFDNPDFSGQPLATGGTLTVTPELGTTTYFIHAEEAGGCFESTSLSVTVLDLPGDSGLPTDPITGCTGESVPLSVNPDFNYTWSPLTGLDLSDPANPVVIITGDITYTVTIDDPASGCSAEVQVTVDANPAPGLQLPADTTLCAAAEITLTAALQNPATVEWFDNPSFNGDPVATGNTLTFTPAEGTTTFYVRADAGNGCVETGQVSVTLFDLPPNSGLPTEPITGCTGETVTLNLNGNYTYTWSPLTGLDLSDPANPVVTINGDITYTVTIDDPASGCSAEVQVTVDASPRAELTVSNDTTLCEIKPVILTAETTVPATVEWFDNPDFSGDPLATGNTFTVTPAPGASTYYVRATTGGGCSENATVTVTVIDLPGNSGLPDPSTTLTACMGETIPLALNPDYVYTWDPLTGLDLTDPANPVIIAEKDIIYTVTIEDPASGCVAESAVTVVVLPRLNLKVTNDTTLCEVAELTLQAATDLPATIEWFDNPDFSGTPLATGNDFTVTPPAGTTTYYVRAMSPDGCPETASVTVTVIDLPGTSGLPEETINLCAGDSITLELNGNYTYTWTPATGLDLTDPLRPVIIGNEDITYTVLIEDAATGCSAEDQVVVDVSPRLNLEVSNDTTLCEPAPLVLVATTSLDAVISWYDNPDFAGNPIATGGQATVTPPVGVTTYYVLAMSAAGCTETDSVQVTVFDPLADSGLKDQADAIEGNGDLIFNLCVGASRILNLNDAFSYQWDPTDGLDLSDPANPVIIATGDADYTVTITDPASGCTTTANVRVRAAALINLTLSGDTVLCEPGIAGLTAVTDLPALISWYDNRDFSGNPLATGNAFNPEVTSAKETYYVLAQGENGCTETDSIMVRIQDVLIESGLDTLNDRTLIACPNEPLRLRLAPGFEYQWDPTDGLDLSDPANPVITLDSDRSYSVTATDPVSGCSASARFDVSVLPPINLVAEPDTTLCEITEIPLRATTDVPASEIVWSTDRNFGNIIGQGTPLPVTPPVGTTVYYARAIDENGCTAIDSVRIDNRTIVAELPPVILCEPAETAELEVVLADPAQQVEYMWAPDPAILSDPMSGPKATVDLTITRDFFVELSNEFCVTELTTTVTVINLPDSLEIVAEPDTIFPGESSRISVSGCADCTFEWSPTTGLDLSDPANPVASPTQTTEYTVIVGTQGCFETLRVTIVVEDFICGLPNIFIPNAFTPNGDGVNDVLRVRGDNITEMKLIIFNRWGQKVFEGNSQDQHWDGTFDGRAVPPDVYGYYLEATCGNGEVYQTKGNVTLLR